MGYAQGFSIDLPNNGDFYPGRLCGEDDGSAEELIKQARTDHQCALVRMPFHDIGNKSLLPSENRQLKSMVDRALNWDWGADELKNRILEIVHESTS